MERSIGTLTILKKYPRTDAFDYNVVVIGAGSAGETCYLIYRGGTTSQGGTDRKAQDRLSPCTRRGLTKEAPLVNNLKSTSLESLRKEGEG